MTMLLVVDDNEQNRYLLQALLMGHGYEVIVASDGAEALDKARANPPDMIISDILMPGMDGYTLCREWKRTENLKAIPFVFYTATYTDPKDEEFALSLGAARFILKPQEPEALVEIIEGVIDAHKSGRLTRPCEPGPEEAVYFRDYNEALIRKLEDKLVQLESTKAALEHEVAERKRVEEHLLLKNAILTTQQETLPGGILVVNYEGRIISYNQRFVEMMKISPELLESDDDEPLLQAVTRQMANPDAFLARVRYLYEHPEEKSRDELVLADGRIFDRYSATMFAVDGRNYGRVWYFRDITENRRAEKEREVLEERYRQAQKMDAVGQLAGGVAHDFNNILQAMYGYSSLLLDYLPEHDELHEFAEQIAQGAERAAGLTRQLLAFSRRQVLEMEDLDLSDVVNGLMKMIRRVIGEDIDVQIMEGRCLGMVRADRGQMEQVLLNLCVNARDAMPEGGNLIIETENVEMDAEYCSIHSWASPGHYALLSVTDTGCGMDAEIQPHIFEPFFTTKGVGKGTGLGLATVYGIVRQHQGMIQVYSEAGRGTTFKVYLPSIERAGITAEPKVIERARGGTETILVAEDDEALRKLTTRILESAGYTVFLAANGLEALDVFEQHAPEVHLCLLDVVMPMMGGKAVYEALRREHPRLRFLFSSGYSTATMQKDPLTQKEVELIQKPYAPGELLRKVRKVLDAAGPE